MASKLITESASVTDHCGVVCLFPNSVVHSRMNSRNEKLELRKPNNRHPLNAKLTFLSGGFGYLRNKQYHRDNSRTHIISCMSNATRNSETTERGIMSKDAIGRPRDENGDENLGIGAQLKESPDISRNTTLRPGIAEACEFVYKDAKFMNERARNDIVLLSRGITRLNDRARQDVALLGVKFLKLDARAREDTEKIDSELKMKAARLHHIASILEDRARTKLKKVADQHWSDGALEADLRRADFIVKRRAMEDAFMALQFVRNIHDMMVNKLLKEDNGLNVDDMVSCISLERNGKLFDLFPGEISTDRVAALQEVYWSMASALSEADGIDYSDPEELELLVTALIDLDAMDGKSSALLLAECSSSPDVNTRKALANALAAAPSMWTLGNAGMGALQRLSEDSNPAVAVSASNAINELRRQWEIQEGDSLTFLMNYHPKNEDPNGNSADADRP